MLEEKSLMCHPKPTGWCPMGVGYSPQTPQHLPIHPYPITEQLPGAKPHSSSEIWGCPSWEGAQHPPITPGLGPLCLPHPPLPAAHPKPAAPSPALPSDFCLPGEEVGVHPHPKWKMWPPHILQLFAEREAPHKGAATTEEIPK